MKRVKILLVTMFVLSLFLMCGCCEKHERRDRHSERSDRDRNLEIRYEERH
jgi:hypothetical protein